jgi:NAD(P)-dependent dehydrogenase (short-subunit alcohol dehydrogenase family)
MLVTGGSRGIGAATARLAAERGWSVGIVYRDRDADAAAVVAAIEATGARALAITAELADEASIAQAFRLADQLGPLRTLVNNAGITGGVSRVADLKSEALDAALRINVWAPFICSREAIRRMSTRHGGNGGSIVNVGSGASQQGSPGVWVHYAATKGAVISMIRSIAVEHARYGVRANAVLPGWIATDMTAGAQGNDKFNDAVIRRVPVRRWGQPADFGGIAVYLASDASAFHTGDSFLIDGGYGIF